MAAEVIKVVSLSAKDSEDIVIAELAKLFTFKEPAVVNCPLLADSPLPAMADTKSAIDSFFELLSPASIIAILSAVTSTTAAVKSFRSSASDTVPLVPPPLRPSPAVTPLISPVVVE